MAKLYFNGHGSLRLTTAQETVIYIDPYAGEGYDIPGDIILVTHQHSDHNQIQRPAKKPECRIIQNTDALRAGRYCDFHINDTGIKAVPAYNRNHSREQCVGYLIEVDGLRLYFAGDTSLIPEMTGLKELNLDYAILPCDGIYNMDIKEASECAAVIGAKHSIPVHVKPGSLFDRKRAEEFRARGRILLEPGEEIEL